MSMREIFFFYENFRRSIRRRIIRARETNLEHPLIWMLANQGNVRERKVRLFVLTRHEIKERANAIHADIHIVRLSRRMY